MENWNESKAEFISKLDSADRSFDEIFRVDAEELVIQGEERKKLKRIMKICFLDIHYLTPINVSGIIVI